MTGGRVHSFASRSHYADHLVPILAEIPPDARGTAWTSRAGAWWGVPGPGQIEPGDVVLVASWADTRPFATIPHARLVYVEHGAGQSYRGDPDVATMPGYCGGDDLDRVVLFVCPSITVATAWRRRYPACGIVVAGCPRMDRWHRGDLLPEPDPSTVALTFHWDCTLCPETRGAWPAYDGALPALAAWADAEGVTLLGHGHPRLWPRLGPRWDQLGIERVPDADEVFERAGALVADNTSMMYEFASLDRPVLALNAPWWRRTVEHGLRFWSSVPGVQIDAAGDLVAGVAGLVHDPDRGAVERRHAVAAAYAHRDGQAARRAAAAIMEAL